VIESRVGDVNCAATEERHSRGDGERWLLRDRVCNLSRESAGENMIKCNSPKAQFGEESKSPLELDRILSQRPRDIKVVKHFR
jgi:hypothetical protein